MSSADFFSVAKRDAFSAAFISGSSVSGSISSKKNMFASKNQANYTKKKHLPGEKIIAEEGLVAADGELKDEDEEDDELLDDFSSCKFLG